MSEFLMGKGRGFAQEPSLQGDFFPQKIALVKIVWQPSIGILYAEVSP